MAPLNGRSALDPRWTRHHTPVPADFMLATIRVERRIPFSEGGGEPTYDPISGTYSNATFQTVFAGLARIQPYGIIGDQNVGQDLTSRRLMRIQIEKIDTGIRIDDMVHVVTCPDSPELTDYYIEVRGAITSSNAWLTDLVGEANAKKVTRG